MPTRTSEMAVMLPKRWGFKKVQVFYGKARITEDQGIIMRGELFMDKKGKVWEFYSRKDETIRAYPVKL